MAHMTHALSICGEDHVGVGSDSALNAWDMSPEDFKKMEDYRHKTGVAAPEEDRPMYVEGLNTPRRIGNHRRCAAEARLSRARGGKGDGRQFHRYARAHLGLVADRILGLVFAVRPFI